MNSYRLPISGHKKESNRAYNEVPKDKMENCRKYQRATWYCCAMILKGATKSRMSSMFVMVDEHLEPNVYNIKPVDGKGAENTRGQLGIVVQ